MITSKKRIFFFLILLIVSISFYFIRQSSINNQVLNTPIDSTESYVNFNMEVYDKISEIYWVKVSDEALANHFKLSLEKVLSTTTELKSKNRKGIEEVLKEQFEKIPTDELKKQVAINIAIVALHNLEPVGRNQMFSQKQETEFRQDVGNINPDKNLYSDLGLESGADANEIKKVYDKKIALLKNATSSEDKAVLEKVKYSYSVLSNPDNKKLYDEAKIEPTLKYRIIGSTFYADLSQIAPTTLFELVMAIENSSTTKKTDTLIIDFRGNRGGSLDFLPAFFGLFVGKDQYAFDLFSKEEYHPQRTTQLKFATFEKFKEIAILTDEMTQSTAELTTSTFKKFRMAKVVGKKTRGWGTVENTYPISSEIDKNEKYVLLLVNSITLREDGQPIEGRGVEPDINITNNNWQKELSKHFKSESLINAIKNVIK